ncbi:MAG: transketolase family protein [Thermodesulfobacteriota bacterium]
MRTAFIKTLFDLAKQDERINLIVGDLGYSVVEPFQKEFPSRFINAGVAEQNMTGMAAGLALSGKIVFTYSIANFPTLRCLEQIRNDICYHKANVKIVAVGGGFAYGALGVTHHATEDLAIMRSLPNMLVIAPGDPVEAKLATQALVEHEGPGYLRLGKAGEPKIHQDEIDFKLGKAIELKYGTDITLISTGGMLFNSLKAAEKLEEQGISVRLLSMHTVKPLDNEAVLKAASETSAMFTIEEHSIIGGLGGAVAETLAESGNSQVYFKRLGIPSTFISQVGNQEYLRNLFSLSAEGILNSVETALKKTESWSSKKFI